MKIGIITLFPNIFNSFLENGLIKKAIKNNILYIYFFKIRKFKNQKIDDYSYGGGGNMVIKCEPIYNAILESKKILGNNSKVLYMSPQGKVLNQKYVNKLSNEKSLIIICGRYEGIDERIINTFVDEEISIGDYILNGGEIPSMVLIESILRLLPGLIKNKKSIEYESFNNNLLDYSCYTRPKIFMNIKVPNILLSGNHNKIYKWRLVNSIYNTLNKRPDLIFKTDFLKKNFFK